jgi:hypothetical protein
MALRTFFPFHWKQIVDMNVEVSGSLSMGSK